ncbi:MAG: AAA family ATPase [Candidatus Rokuibacteriota bacterium]
MSTPSAPHTLAPLFDNIPAELRALRQWVVWAHTWKDGDQKFAKVPYSPATGANASSTDPATWGTFEEAVAAYTASRANADDNYDGIGFVFTGTPYMGVDQDHVLDRDVLAPEAIRIVAELDTYTEVSPSGTGVKSFIKAKKPGNGWSKITGLGLEMYDEGRYFTITGHHLAGTPTAPQARQEAVDALYRRGLSEKSVPKPTPVPSTTPMTDDELVKKIAGSAQGGKFMRLYAGLTDQYGGDESGADMALAGVLAFWTQDAEQIERVMRKSGLVRPKWDESRPGGTYLSVTIDKALENVTETYGARLAHDFLGLVPLDTIDMKPVPWLWPGYLPLGATSLFVGDPGNGKTLSGLDLLARITVGAAWPDGTRNEFGPRNVIVLSAEDANEYTIRPRIEAAGGDSARVLVIPADKSTKLSLDTDVERLRAAIVKHQPLAVLIDPLSAYMPGIDTYRDNEVRSSLARFVALLDEHGVAAVAIVHMSKNIERNAMQRVLGSTAFTALSRSTFMVSRDPDAHEGDDTRRLFLALKFNLGRTPEGRAFRIVGKSVKGDGVVIEAPTAEWEQDTVKADANEVLRQLQRPSDARRELHEAMLAVVKDGPVTQKDAKEALARFAKSDDALLAQRKKLGIETMRDPADTFAGPYYWLPPRWDPKAREAWTQDRMAQRRPPSAA